MSAINIPGSINFSGTVSAPAFLSNQVPSLCKTSKQDALLLNARDVEYAFASEHA